MSAATPMRDPLDLLDISSVLTPEERDIQSVVASFVTDKVRPHVGEWFEEAHFPREMAAELGRLGVLGMHLDGYGCAGRIALPDHTQRYRSHRCHGLCPGLAG